MTFKKIMLVASMAMAAVAFAAPAAQAEAPEWYVHTGPGTEETLQNPANFEITGELSSNVIGSGLVIGPCHVIFEGTAENVNGMAAGTVEEGEIAEHCNTNIPGCTFTPTLEVGNWPLTGVTITGEPGVEINEANLTQHFNATCQAYGIPATVTAIGTATALLDEEAPTGECVTFEEHLDDLFIGGPLGPRFDFLGTACIEAPLTLH